MFLLLLLFFCVADVDTVLVVDVRVLDMKPLHKRDPDVAVHVVVFLCCCY